MFLFYFSITLAIVFSVLYHLFQKFTPANVNPAIAFAVTYATAFVACLLLLPFFPPKDGLTASLKQLNWASIALGLAVVGLEIGFLLVYRGGWNISVAGVVANAGAAILLILVGLLLFKEKLTPVNLVGIVVCIVGLIMVNQK